MQRRGYDFPKGRESEYRSRHTRRASPRNAARRSLIQQFAATRAELAHASRDPVTSRQAQESTSVAAGTCRSPSDVGQRLLLSREPQAKQQRLLALVCLIVLELPLHEAVQLLGDLGPVIT
jgi:hypothetical protein